MNVFAAKELEAADLLALARLDDDGAPPAVTPPPARDGRGRHAIPFAGAVARVREALRAQGFGVLTEIDVQATLRDKLGVNMEPYLVLGACNPSLAHQALSTGRRIGLLLPCTVVIRTEASRTVIEALDPQPMVAVAGEPSLQPSLARQRPGSERHRTPCEKRTGLFRRPWARRHRHAARGPKTLSGMTIVPASDTP